MDTVRVRWVGKRQFTAWDEAGHGIVMDAPSSSKGESTGMRPVELVLYGLGGCTAMDVVSVLEKKRLDVRGVEVVLKGTQIETTFPHYYERIEMEYIVTGVDIPDAAVHRAIELSETKYCSVKGCLGPQVDVTWTFRVQEPAPLGPPAPDAE
ncbi:MAG: OsmC family protein [Coriobacteriia bacterium]|nr:OsmC family protein [Coriobacteriia bacterium]